MFEETIAQDIAFGPKNLGLSADDVDERVRDAMKFVGLDYDTYAERSPFHLSGGQNAPRCYCWCSGYEPRFPCA